jgi:pentatricopeptide repeat protein
LIISFRRIWIYVRSLFFATRGLNTAMLQTLARSVRTAPSLAAAASSTSQLRPFSSSASTSFLFNRPPPANAAKILQDLVDARTNARLDIISKLYPSLVTAVQSLSGGAPLSHARLQSVMRFVASTNRFTLLLKMFDDLPLLGFEHTAHDHHILILGMARAGKVSKALKWIETMARTHGIHPSTSDWNVVLGGYRRAGDLEGMKDVVERMRAAGYAPNVVTYNSLISALFEFGRIDDVREMVREMEENEVRADLWTETALLTGFVEAGELASAREVKQRLERVLDQVDGPPSDTAAVNAFIKFESADKGFPQGSRLAKRYRDRGYALDAWTLNTLAREGAKGLATAEEGVRMLEDLEDVTGATADRRSWSIVLSGVLSGEGGLPEALKVHQEARDRSIQPDSSMVQPLLQSLLLPSPSPSSLAIAKTLYEDLAQASRSYHTSPDLSIYVTLLRACADPSHPDLEYSRTLVTDMRERGVRLDGASVTWHIVALMRAASSFEEAFQAYDQIRALDPTALDQSAYNTILAAFTSLSFPSPASPLIPTQAPPPLIMEFLSDMRHSSPPQPPNSITYSLLLSYYSRTHSASASSISHLHSLIKLDINLDPDTALFNSLMGAYSRVGAFNAAYRIWDSMRANPTSATRVDNVSLSIMLDTCGWNGGKAALRRAEQVWADAVEGRIDVRPNRKNWDSWVECLCRLGEFDRAERIVFEEMGREVGLETVEMLLKMVRRSEDGDERWKRVRERVRNEMSEEVWERVQAVAPWGKGGERQAREDEGKMADSRE